MVYAVILLLMYIPPFTVFKDSGPSQLFVYWALLGLLAVAYSWLETKRWR